MIFKIKKDKHFCEYFYKQIVPFFSIKEIKKKITFLSSCEYLLSDGDQPDWNKLIGFCSIFHHWDSARFGWAWNPRTKKMDISAYYYVRSKVTYTKILSVDLEEEYTYQILNDKYTYQFIISDRYNTTLCNYIVSKRKFWLVPFGYTLSLFFGGNKTAPHDMYVKID